MFWCEGTQSDSEMQTDTKDALSSDRGYTSDTELYEANLQKNVSFSKWFT